MLPDALVVNEKRLSEGYSPSRLLVVLWFLEFVGGFFCHPQVTDRPIFEFDLKRQGSEGVSLGLL